MQKPKTPILVLTWWTLGGIFLGTMLFFLASVWAARWLLTRR